MTVAPGERQTAAVRRLALVGQPNVGKSALFHALTGRYVTVSNYPGTTVEIARGVSEVDGEAWSVVDTPGIRSLLPRSEDEIAARDCLLAEPPDVLVQVADAKQLRRALHLTLELASLGRPMVLALNLSDEARSRGFRVDAGRLSEALGFPVVETVAVTGEGVSELKDALKDAAAYAGPPGEPDEVRRAVLALAGRLSEDCPSPAAVAESVLSRDPSIARRLNGLVREEAEAIRKRFVTAPEWLAFAGREAAAAELSGRTSWCESCDRPEWVDKLGLKLLEPLSGAFAVAAVLWLMYRFVGVFAAQTAVEFMEEKVFGEWLLPPVVAGLSAVLPSGWFLDLWVGEMGLITMGLTYAVAIILPVVTAFFLFFGVLEDSGYLPRLSVLLDRIFRGVGLNGKAVFPMLLGLGCGTMATLTARVLDTRRERVLVTLLLALAVPCSAQLGVVMGLLAGLSPWALAAWLAAVLAAFFSIGWAAARLLPGSRTPFWVEVPPLRLPRASNLAHKLKARVVWYLGEAVPLFLIGTLILFVLDRTGGLRSLESALKPLVVGWLGLPTEATFALVSGFLKRDYGAAGFFDLARKGALGTDQVVVALVTLTLFLPCVAQFLVMIKERGAKAAGLVTLIVTAAALAAGGAVRIALAALGGLP